MSASVPQSLPNNQISFNHNAHMLHHSSNSPTPVPNTNTTFLLPYHATNTMQTLPSTPIPPALASSTQIVSVYRSLNPTGFIFQCDAPGCAVTFSRWTDFERHDNAKHGGTSVLWCSVQGCNRSKKEGNKPFPGVRGDKLGGHVRKVHGVAIDVFEDC
jgi:hypothetical protein